MSDTLKSILTKPLRLFGKDTSSKAKSAEKGKKDDLGVVLKLVVFIIDWNKVNILTDVLQGEGAKFHFICKARGTANSEVLNVLGVGSTEKAVVICLDQDVLVPELFKKVSKKLGLNNPGSGIAFTIPLSGISRPFLLRVKASLEHGHNNLQTLLKEENMSTSETTQSKYDLIVIAVTKGFSDELMAVAREVGASGGTVINARSIANEGAVKFFGISVQNEREIVTILSRRDKKTPIMQAVIQKYGIATDAKGIVFSLPVESIVGLDLE